MSQPNWADIIADPPTGWTFREPILHADSSPSEQAKREAYNQAGGARQRVRSADPEQAGHYDLPFYRDSVAALTQRLPADPLVVDLGCGDGRGIHLLRQHGVRRLIAQDFNETDLIQLRDSLPDAADRSQTLLLCGSATDPPLLPSAADAVVMAEVAYTLDEPRDGYVSCARWLRPGGLALVSNVAVHAYLIHAMLNAQWEQIESILATGTYQDTFGGQTVQVRPYDEERMDVHAHDAGFVRVRRQTVPGGAGVMLHALRQRGEAPIEHRALLEGLTQHLMPQLPRIYIDLLCLEGSH